MLPSVNSDPAPPLNEPESLGLSHVEYGSAEESARLGFLTKLGNLAMAAKYDLEASKHKFQTLSIGLGITAIQALSRIQASWVFVPEVAINVFKDTRSPVEAAFAGGLAFGGWCLATGAATAEGLSKYPRTVKEFSRSFPGFVDFFRDSLPGLNNSENEKKEDTSFLQKAGKRIVTLAKRGLTVTGIGSAIYAGTATINGMERKDVHKLNAEASFEGGFITGGFIFGLGELIVKIAHDN